MLRRLHHTQPESFEFTPGNLAWAEKQIAKYPDGVIFTRTREKGELMGIRTEPLPLALMARFGSPSSPPGTADIPARSPPS